MGFLSRIFGLMKLSNPVALVTTYWPIIFAVIIGGCILWLNLYIGNLKSTIGKDKEQLGTLQGQVNELNGTIKEWQSAYQIITKQTSDQNAAIALLQKNLDTSRAAQQQAAKAVSGQQLTLQRQLVTLRSQPKSEPATTSCLNGINSVMETLK